MSDQTLHDNVISRLSHFRGDAIILLKEFGLLRPLVYRAALSVITEDISLPEEEVNSLQLDYLRSNHLSSEDELREHLSAIGMSDTALVEQLCISNKVSRFASITFAQKSESHFLKRKDDLDLVTYSMIRVKDENLAFELFLRLEDDPLSFASLARTYGEGPERNHDGRITNQNIAAIDPFLSNLLRRSKAGQVSEPFLLQNWWILVKLNQLDAARFDDRMRQKMCHELLEQWLNREIDLIIKSI